jgi:hypothetical protein
MAKKKISGLPAGSALNGTELVPIVQAGTTKRITTQDIANLGNSSGVEGSGTIGTLAKFTASSTIGNSALVEASSYIQSSKRIEADDAGYGLVAFSSSGNRQVVLGVNTGEPAIQGTLLNGTPRQLAINPSGGDVGIGISNPLGLLHLFKAGATTRMVIDGNPAQNRIITYRTNGVQRFGFYVNNTAESGANAGSDFAIRAYNDAGTLLNTPLFIQRSTGFVGVNTITPQKELEVSSSIGATLRLKRDDGNITDDESVGTLEFFTNDGDGPHVNSYVRGLGADIGGNFGRYGALSFGVSLTANTDAVEIARFDEFGYLRLAALSGGIQFHGDTSSANALNDYEEGTFTATITPSTSGTITSSASFTTWSYTKIGRQVTINGVFVISAISSPIGKAIIVGGLPFTILNSNSNFGAFSATIYNAAIDDDTVHAGRHSVNTTQLTIGKDASTIIVNDEIYVTATYFV